MKTLLCCIGNRADVVSYYRGAGPLTSLPKDCGWQVRFVDKSASWVDVVSTDAVFMLRPTIDVFVSLFNTAKEANIPVWVDYDDELLNIPRSNPVYKTYQDQGLRRNIQGFLANADVVTVSTTALANSYASHLKLPARILRNAWNCRTQCRIPTANSSKNILWRGSATHDEDIDYHLPAIKAIAEKHPTWNWFFVGHAFWKLEQVIDADRLKFIGPSDFLTYWRFASNAIQPAVAVVPLKDNRFNRCKSNIAWIEGTWLGAAVVAPDMEEWRHDGASLYDPNDPLAMAAAFDRALEDREGCVRRSWAVIEERFTVEKTNQTRLEILNAMVGDQAAQ